MLVREINGLRFYCFPGLAAFPEVVHGVFTRLGGVSRDPYASLNVSFAVGDDSWRVRENRSRLRKVLDLHKLVSAVQVHGNNGALVTANNSPTEDELPAADLLLTQEPGVGLMIKQADCQAVMLYDPEHRAVANVHCGWRGQVENILGQAVARMREAFASQPQTLWAAIGPGLGPCCAEFRRYQEEFPPEFWRYQVRPGYFDLVRLSRDQLVAAGLNPGHIEVAGICTRCQAAEFYSYRRERLTGRQGAVIALRV